MNQEIGLRIQEVRKKKGLSRGDLADMSGISPKFIFQIEKQGFGFSVVKKLSASTLRANPV